MIASAKLTLFLMLLLDNFLISFKLSNFLFQKDHLLFKRLIFLSHLIIDTIQNDIFLGLISYLFLILLLYLFFHLFLLFVKLLEVTHSLLILFLQLLSFLDVIFLNLFLLMRIYQFQ